MVNEVRVAFDPRPLPSADITVSLPTKKAVEGSRQLQELLVAGFRDRFPGLAAKYGLTVTPGASYQLRVRTIRQVTQCTLSCWSRVTLRARLSDLSAGGKELWSFDATVGLAVGANGVADGAFDPLGEEILQAMKKENFIAR